MFTSCLIYWADLRGVLMLSSLPESHWRHTGVTDVNAALTVHDVQRKGPILLKRHSPQNSQSSGYCSAVDRRRSVFGNNKSWLLLLACFTVPGNSCQQECSLSPHLSPWDSASLLVGLVLHTTTSCKQAGLPSPLPSSTSDLWRSHLTSLCTRTITLSFLERVIAAFLKVIFRGSDHQFKGFNLLINLYTQTIMRNSLSCVLFWYLYITR